MCAAVGFTIMIDAKLVKPSYKGILALKMHTGHADGIGK